MIKPQVAPDRPIDLNKYREWKERMERAGGQAAFSFSVPPVDILCEKEESDDQKGEDDA